jgi:hypothetical protein
MIPFDQSIDGKPALLPELNHGRDKLSPNQKVVPDGEIV